ncbi:MAG: hypothetical protein ACRC7H_04415 [Plesiomonas shigelloides]
MAIKLTEEFSKLTTFNTIFGSYRFYRLQFGIISAQDEFHWKIYDNYVGLTVVIVIVNDILVYGQTQKEHDENLRAMLQRSLKKGVKLNPEKSTVGTSVVRYSDTAFLLRELSQTPKRGQAHGTTKEQGGT